MDPPKSKKARLALNENDFDDYIEDKSDDETEYKLKNYVTDGKIKDNYPLNEFNAKDYTSLEMKENDHNYPLWVAPSGQIYLETYNKLGRMAQEFLITIAEPVSRPALMHTYKITSNSLYAAVSSGVNAADIEKYLGKFCKTTLPTSIVDFIKEATHHFGKANLVLRNGEYKIESRLVSHLRCLIADREIGECLLKGPDGEVEVTHESVEPEPTDAAGRGGSGGTGEMEIMEDVQSFMKQVDEFADEAGGIAGPAAAAGSGEGVKKTRAAAFSVQIEKGKLEKVQQRCKTLEAALLVEYDFRADTEARDIALELRPTTNLRPYQERALRKMFGSGRARSGIIVLPCGAGKTLVGLTAACTMKKSTIVFCTGGVAVEQWRQHFRAHASIETSRITRFTGNYKESTVNCDIFITTYAMVGNTRSRNTESRNTLAWVNNQVWGLIILDEVHTIPADTFRSVLNHVYGHCKLGLTATLVREDNKIEDLNFLVGPKLYEADWMELQDRGFIARVQCMEVRCPMTPEFFWEYLNAPASRQMLLYVMNPEKLRRCEFLMKYHEKRGDKIIVFSDNLFALRTYARLMNKCYLEGSTSHEERMSVMENFRKNPKVSTIFVSKLADVALDLPEANVLIQISSQGASRRQEAQRLGRITRAKKGMRPNEINAFFYTLISADTTEQMFSVKRQQYLKDQGYAFKIVTELSGMEKEDLLVSTKSAQGELLMQVLSSRDDDNAVETAKPPPAPGAAQSRAKNKTDLLATVARKRRDLVGTDGNRLYLDTSAPSASAKPH